MYSGDSHMVGRKMILFSIMFYGIIEILANNTLGGGPRSKKSENRGCIAQKFYNYKCCNQWRS